MNTDLTVYVIQIDEFCLLQISIILSSISTIASLVNFPEKKQKMCSVCDNDEQCITLQSYISKKKKTD